MAGADYFLRGLEMWNRKTQAEAELAFRDKQAKVSSQLTRDQMAATAEQRKADNAWRATQATRIDSLERDRLKQSDKHHEQELDLAKEKLKTSVSHIDRQFNFNADVSKRDYERQVKIDEVTADQFNRRLGEQVSQHDDLMGLKEREMGLKENQESRIGEAYNNEVDKRQGIAEANRLRLEARQETRELQQRSQQEYTNFVSKVQDGGYHDITEVLLGENIDPEAINSARGNSGIGAGVHVRFDPKSNSYALYTKNKENPEEGSAYVPFTADPNDNDSTPLRISKEQLLPVMAQVANVRGGIEESGDEGNLTSAFLGQMGGLIVQEDGEVVTGAVHDARLKAKEEYREAQLLHEQEMTQTEEAKKYEEAQKLRGMFNFGVTMGSTVGDAPEVAITDPNFGAKTWRDYLKGKLPDASATQRASAAKLFGDAASAINATRGKREEAMELMLKADPTFDVARADNFIETGTYASKEELRALDLKNRKEVAEYEMVVAELDAQQAENNGVINAEDFYKKTDRVMQNVAQEIVPYNIKNRGEALKQASAEIQEITANFIMSTGVKPSTLVGFEGERALRNMFSIRARLNKGRENPITSLGPAYAMALTGIDFGDNENMNKLKALQDKFDITLDEAAVKLVTEVNAAKQAEREQNLPH